MMANLFSSFDPSTPNFLSSNWLSALLILILLPGQLFVSPKRPFLIISQISEYLKKELTPLTKKFPYVIPSLITLFFTIASMNFMGLFPYVFTPTSHAALSFPVALTLWLSLMLMATINNLTNTLIHMVPSNTPNLLMPLMVLIELVSNLIRPLTLGIRLAANMTAGHLLITLLASASPMTPLLATPLLIFSQVALNTLEMAVAMIQGYVFMILASLYTAESSS